MSAAEAVSTKSTLAATSSCPGPITVVASARGSRRADRRGGGTLSDQFFEGIAVTDWTIGVRISDSVIEGQGFKTLQDGETVEYEAEEGPKGSKATKVRRLAATTAG